MNRRDFVLATMGSGLCHAGASERYPYATEALVAAVEKPDLPCLAAHTVVIHNPAPGTYQYSHHPHIICAFGTFLAMWISGIEREDRPGQRILWSRSADGIACWRSL